MSHSPGGPWGSRTNYGEESRSRHSADGGGQERSHFDNETVPMKRLLEVLMAVSVLLLLSATLEVEAGGASESPSHAVITFDDVAQAVHLTIPTPACPESEPQCQWKFFLNEPQLHVDVATVYGTSGTLTIDYPSNFCGVIQADAYVGPPWVAERGYQHTIADCAAATTASTEPPSAGATSEPPTTPTTPTSAPPQAPPQEAAAAATVPPLTPPPITAPSTTAPEAAGAPKAAQPPVTR